MSSLASIRLSLKVDGSVVKRKEKDAPEFIEITSLTTGVTAPFDMDRGSPGMRHHQEVAISKAVDSSSPLLMQALCKAKKVDEAVFKFFRQGKRGAEENYYTVTLKNAYITAVTQSLDMGGEHISFAYEQITWEWMEGGVMHTDMTVAEPGKA